MHVHITKARLFSFVFTLIFSFSCYADNLLLEPFLGNEDEVTFDANILAASEEAGYVIFSSYSAEIPGYDGVENSHRFNLVYIKELATGNVTLLSKGEGGWFASGIAQDSFSEISNDGAVFFVHTGHEPLAGTEFEGEWSELGTYLFRLDLDTKKITPIPVPEVSSSHYRWLITKNEYLYTYDRITGNVLYSTDLGANWISLDLTCGYGVNFHDFSHNGGVFFTCENYPTDSVQYFDPATQTLSKISGIPTFETTAAYHNDGVELSSDGSSIVYSDDNIIKKVNRTNSGIEQFSLAPFEIRNVKVLAMDDAATFVFFSGYYSNNIDFQSDSQEFAQSTQAVFYMPLSIGAAPQKVDIFETDNGLSNLSILRVFMSNNDSSSIFQSQNYTTAVGRSAYKQQNELLASHDFSPSISEFNLTLANEGAHSNKVTVEHDSTDELLIKIERKSHKYGITDYFWLTASEYIDYEMGLKPGINTYKAWPCNLNMVCAEQYASSNEITTLDYTVNDTWSVEITESESYYSSDLTGKIINFDQTTSENAKATIVNHLTRHIISPENYTFRINNNIENLVVGLQPCTTSRLYNENYVCSETASVKTTQLPAIPNVKLLLALDYSYITIHFEQNENTKYNIQRRTGNGVFSEVATDVNSGWQDSDIIPGGNYEYRVMACDTSLSFCRKSITQNMLVDRKGNMNLNSNSNNDIGGILLRIYNQFDTDEIRILRATGDNNYEQIASLPAHIETFEDKDLIPGIRYDYQVQSIVNSELYDDASSSTYTNELYNINSAIETEITDITIDTSFALGHLITWNAVDNVAAWRFEVLRNNYVQQEHTIAADTPSFFYNYEDNLYSQEAYNYRITPIYSLCATDASDCDTTEGGSATISGELPDPLLDEKGLYPVSFTLNQESIHSISVNISNAFINDSYVLERKSIDDESWTQFNYFVNDSDRNEIQILDASANLRAGKTYQYRIKTCSALLNKCTTSSIEQLQYRGERYSGETIIPEITFEKGQFVVDFNFEEDSFVAFAEVSASWDENRNRKWTTPSLKQNFFIEKEWSMETGETVSFSVRYCFHRPERPYYETEDCTDFSDEISVELSNDSSVFLPELYWFGVSISSDDTSINLTGRFETSSSYGRPTTVDVYRATNGGNYETIGSIQIVDDESNHFEFSDSNFNKDTFYSYAVKACNEGGCDERISTTIKVSSTTIEEIPAKPEVTFISNGEFTNKIRIELSSRTQGASFTGYKSDSADGEFQEFGYTSWRNYLEDENVAANTTYYYRIDACNNAGCSSSDIVQGTSSSVYFNQVIEISGEALRNLDTGANSIVTLDGQALAIAGVLDAFTGELRFNQWLDLSEGLDFTTTARLNANWAQCTELMDFSLYLPRASYNYYSNRLNLSLGTLVYTGNGCENNTELELFSLYLVSDFLSEPVLLDSDIRENWQSYSLHLNEEGFFNFLIGDDVIATSVEAINPEIWKLSKFLLATNNNWYVESTHISNATLNVEAQSSLTETDLLSYYSPHFEEIHPRNIAITMGEELSGTVQYLKVENGIFEEPNEIELSSGGRYDAYIKALSPNKEYNMLFRKCQSETCGPFEYMKLQTPGYRDSIYTSHIWAGLDYQSSSIKVEIGSYEVNNVDSFSIFREIVGQENSKQTIAQYTIEDVLTHWLQSHRQYSVLDLFEENQTAIYTFELCNPVVCQESSRSAEVTMPGDADNDGVLDPFDAFPNDPNESYDSDGDGIGNNADEDDDGDGIPDAIELENGLDPISYHDGYEDLDGDGFNNIYEFVTGSEMNDFTITPQDTGVYESFTQEQPRFVDISGNFIRETFSADGDYSIWAEFNSHDSVPLTFTIKGKLTGDYLVFSNYNYRSHQINVRINGKEFDLTQISFSYMGSDGGFSYYGLPLEATEDEITLELEFHYIGSHYPSSVYIDNLFIPMTNARLVNVRSTADYDGDGKSDIAVRKGAISMNYVLNSSDEAIQRVQFGSQAEDIQVEGDFDGDGIADIAVRRPSKGIWYVQNSSGSNFGSERGDGVQRVVFGKQAEDIPVAADYDGDGITDFAVRRASNSMWYIKNSSGSNYNSSNEDGIQRVQFGLQETDIPVPADYDGDGITDIAFRRPSNSTWYILESSSGEIQRIQFGLQETDIPVPADFDGDGKADVAFRRPSNKIWYILRSSDEVIERIQFGLNEADIPVVGDYDGDGKADIAVRRESNAMWYVLQSSDGEIGRFNFGKSDGMVPVLAPIWEKLNMLGWDSEFISPSLEGRTENDAMEDDEFIMLDKTQHYHHPELQRQDRILQESQH